MSSAFDVAVIGGGTAGLYAAQTASTRGRRVVLVERHRLGGECTWNGCVPSKSLIAAARVAHAVRAGGRLGVDVDSVWVDFPRVMARVRCSPRFVDDRRCSKSRIYQCRAGGRTRTEVTLQRFLSWPLVSP